MTPYEIGILLHYYAHVDDHPDIDRQPPIWTDTIVQMVNDALLLPCVTTTDARYRLLDRGRAYCEALQRVPLPEQAWVTRWPLSEPMEKR